MKITDVRIIGPTLVEVETDEGITGIGATAAPKPAIAALLESETVGLRPLLIGEDPTDINRLWRKMSEEWPAQVGRGGEGGMAVNAMAAVDIALWDIAGKACHLPIYKLLGGAIQPEVMVYASTSRSDRRLVHSHPMKGKTVEEMVQECEEYVEQGFKAIKFGWGNFFDSDGQEALAAIRQAIGSDIRLMIDFGCPDYVDHGWNVKDAIKVARLLKKYDIFFLEEALHPHDVEGFATLTQHSPIKIATGESLTTVRDFQRFIEGRAVDVVQPDAQQMGITQFIRVAQRAEEAGILCIPHGPWTAILVAAHLNVLATLSNGILIEYAAYASFEEGTAQQIETDAMLNKVIETPSTLRNGHLQLPESPGLGLGSFVPEAIAELERETVG